MGADFWERFVLAVLATWRVTHLLATEDGPGKVLVRLRARFGAGILGELMDCFGCLSLWVAFPAALFVTLRPLELLFTWLALSGGAFIIERLGQEPLVVQQLSEPIEGEPRDVMLRTAPGEPQDRAHHDSPPNRVSRS